MFYGFNITQFYSMSTYMYSLYFLEGLHRIFLVAQLAERWTLDSKYWVNPGSHPRMTEKLLTGR